MAPRFPTRSSRVRAGVAPGLESRLEEVQHAAAVPLQLGTLLLRLGACVRGCVGSGECALDVERWLCRHDTHAYTVCHRTWRGVYIQTPIPVPHAIPIQCAAYRQRGASLPHPRVCRGKPQPGVGPSHHGQSWMRLRTDTQTPRTVRCAVSKQCVSFELCVLR
jgi:hypothetical protein